MVQEKRKLRKIWQSTRHSSDKKRLNKMTKELKMTLIKFRNDQVTRYLTALTPTSESNYSLWKTTKKLTNKTPRQPPLQKPNGMWARTNQDKATALADHFQKTFANDNNPSHLIQLPNTSKTDYTDFVKLTVNKIIQKIEELNDKKAAGYDLITGKILKMLPKRAVSYIRNLFNACLRLQYYPTLWKIAEITAIPKVGKDAALPSSYRPISLLPLLSKIFEKVLYERLTPILEDKHTIPDHQFGFRRLHSTIHQIHRVTSNIESALEEKKFCVGLFLDVEKAFDKVWHDGLLLKLSSILPSNL